VASENAARLVRGAPSTAVTDREGVGLAQHGVLEGGRLAGARVDPGDGVAGHAGDLVEVAGGVDGGAVDGQGAHGRVGAGVPGQQGTGPGVVGGEPLPRDGLAADQGAGEVAADVDHVTAVGERVHRAVERRRRRRFARHDLGEGDAAHGDDDGGDADEDQPAYYRFSAISVITHNAS
jgi:hypothetical protein